MNKAEYPDPPEGLSASSGKLWRTIGPARVDTPGRQVLFEEALRALDRANEARALVASEGLTSKTPATGAVHLNPTARLERDSRAQFSSLWTALGLHLGEIQEPEDIPDSAIDRMLKNL
jgi:hypothetical protein